MQQPPEEPVAPIKPIDPKDTNENNENEEKSSEEEKDVENAVQVTDQEGFIENKKNKVMVYVIKVKMFLQSQVKKSVDFVCLIYTSSVTKFIAIMNNQKVQKYAITGGKVALFGVCVFTLSYLPYKYISQNKLLSN